MKNFGMYKLLLIPALFVQFQLAAQNSSFRLSDYTNPDYKYKSLDLNFGLSHYLMTARLKNYQDNSINNFQAGSSLGAVYRSSVNSKYRQGQVDLNFNSMVGSNRNSNSTDNPLFKSSSSTFSHAESFDFQLTQRFYRENKNFMEIGVGINTYNNGNQSKNKEWTNDALSASFENKIHGFAPDITLNLFLGHGRIEQVQDARMAMYILDDVQKLGRAQKVPDNDDVMELARLITRLKYNRYFDTRLRKIAEITAIDSLLQGSGLINTPDAAYFTVLTDNWNYSNNPIRTSGNRLYGGLQVNYAFNYQFTSQITTTPDNYVAETTEKQQNSALALVAGYASANPMSLQWQRTAGAEAGIGLARQLNKREEVGPDVNIDYSLYGDIHPALNLSAFYGYGYYPNSRTTLSFSWSVQSEYFKRNSGNQKNDDATRLNNMNVTTGPDLSIYYYVSARLRVTINYYGYFDYLSRKYTFRDNPDSNYKETLNNFNQSFSGTITYSLF